MQTPVTIDESTGYDRTQSYSYTRVADLGGRRVRARIHRNYYPFQSHAVAEVLSHTLTWTHFDQQGPVGMAFAQGEVIDAQHAGNGEFGLAFDPHLAQ